MPNRAAAPLGPATTHLDCLRAARIWVRSASSSTPRMFPVSSGQLRPLEGSAGGMRILRSSSGTFNTGPVIADQRSHCFRRDRFDAPVHAAAKLLNEMANEHGNVFAPFPQWGHSDGKNVQPVV